MTCQSPTPEERMEMAITSFFKMKTGLATTWFLGLRWPPPPFQIRKGLTTTFFLDDKMTVLSYYHITILVYRGEGMSISHPLQSDGDGHQFLKWGRDWPPHDYSITEWLYYCIPILAWYCYLIILRGCYINLPPFRVRWKWPPTPFECNEGIDHHIIIRLLDDYIIGFLYYHSLCSYLNILWRWHVNLPLFRVRWRWPPPPL